MNALINGVTYHYDDTGSNEALMLLHGFTGTRKTWQAMTPFLSRAFRVITPDLLGHGGTDSPAQPEHYTIRQAAEDLIALLDHLNIEQVHLGGYSMGGRLALYMAVHHPQRILSLMLEGASPGLKTEAERAERYQADSNLADRIERDGIEAFVDYWEALPLWDTQSPKLKQYLRQERLAQNPLGLANSLRGMGTGVQLSLWDDLQYVTVPVQLFVGQNDTKFTLIGYKMTHVFPRVRMTSVFDAGHAVHLEKPDTFTMFYHEFLNNLDLI